MLEASCHCGAITIAITDLPDTVTACTCSICRRYGALWAYLDDQSASVTATPDKLVSYVWGDKGIAFQHCAHCGCMTHYESLVDEAPRRVAVNARMLPPEITARLSLRTFDGAETWQYID